MFKVVVRDRANGNDLYFVDASEGEIEVRNEGTGTEFKGMKIGRVFIPLEENEIEEILDESVASYSYEKAGLTFEVTRLGLSTNP